MGDEKKRTISFAEFDLDIPVRRLNRNGEIVTINAKAFDLLVFLVENAGRVITKDEIMSSVWEDQFVEEANLAVQISTLRKALGESKAAPRFLFTIPRKGYQFVGDVNLDVVIESNGSSNKVVEQLKATDEPASFSPDVSGRPGPRKTLWVIAAGGLLLFAAVIVWTYRTTRPNGAQERQFAARVFATAGGGMPIRAAISTDGSRVAFVENSKGRNSLRVGNIDSSDSIEIIPAQERSYDSLVFGPDGKNIYFTARDANHRETTLMRVSVFGGAVAEIAAPVDSSVTFSPDARSVVYLRRDMDGLRTSLMMANAENGRDERVLTVRSYPENVVGSGAAWSSDGKMIAIAAADKAGGSIILGIDTNDGSVRTIGERVENRIVNIVWQADGRGLFVNRNTSNDAGDGKIWFISYPDGKSQQITDDSSNYHISSLSISSDAKIVVIQDRADTHIRFAPTGDIQRSRDILEGTRFRAEGRHGVALAPDGKILFTANSADSGAIWEMDVEKNNQRQITSTRKGGDDQQVNVTPDNRYLVFESNRSGASEIWRSNRDGSDVTVLTTGGKNRQPTLSPDGQWVVYTGERDGRNGLWRVSIDGGEPKQITTEKSFWPSVSPDGGYIAFDHGRLDSDPKRELWVIPFEGGDPVKAFEVPTSSVLYNRLRWSSDGKGIFYKDDSLGLWYQDLAAAEPQHLKWPDDLRVYQFAYSVDGDLVYATAQPISEIVILNPTAQ